jgi:3-methyladenine DNA glycosylase AlkC
MESESKGKKKKDKREDDTSFPSFKKIFLRKSVNAVLFDTFACHHHMQRILNLWYRRQLAWQLTGEPISLQ